MDAIDTNVLVRYLVQDEPRQGKKARNFIDNGEPKYVSHIVFIETVWVLESSYGLDCDVILEALSSILLSAYFFVAKANLITKALGDYQHGFDFADMLIGYWGESECCNHTYTFDKKASKHKLFELLK